MERLFISRGGKVCTAARLPEAVLGVRRVETPHLQQDAAARFGALAQLGERGLCKPEVRGSIPLCSTTNTDRRSKRRPAIFFAGRPCPAARRPSTATQRGNRTAAARRRALVGASATASPAPENVSRETFRRPSADSFRSLPSRTRRGSHARPTRIRHLSDTLDVRFTQSCAHVFLKTLLEQHRFVPGVFHVKHPSAWRGSFRRSCYEGAAVLTPVRHGSDTGFTPIRHVRQILSTRLCT